MGFRLKTSEKTKEIFEELSKSTTPQLKPYVLAKLSVALSLKVSDSLYTSEQGDERGLELHRQTVVGSHDPLYKALIEQHCNRPLNDDEYYPLYMKMHIDRGAVLLHKQYKYASNLETFIKQIVKGDLKI